MSTLKISLLIVFCFALALANETNSVNDLAKFQERNIQFYGSQLSCDSGTCTGSVTLSANEFRYVTFLSDGLGPQIGYSFSCSSSHSGFYLFMVDQNNFNIIANGGTSFQYYTAFSSAQASYYSQYPGSGGTGRPPSPSGRYYLVVISATPANTIAYNIEMVTSSSSTGTTSDGCCVSQCGSEANIITASCVNGVSQCTCRNSGSTIYTPLVSMLVSLIAIMLMFF